MYEPDPGVELCVPCQAFFEAGHADQYDANFTGIEYGAYLFKATYSETIRLINNDQRRRVRKAPRPGSEFADRASRARANGRASLLAAGKGDAAFPDHGLVAFRKAFDIVRHRPAGSAARRTCSRAPPPARRQRCSRQGWRPPDGYRQGPRRDGRWTLHRLGGSEGYPWSPTRTNCREPGFPLCYSRCSRSETTSESEVHF